MTHMKSNKKNKLSRLQLILIVLLIVIVAVICLKIFNNNEIYGPYSLVYVIDGDTIMADIDGKTVKIRLIGIDAPESVHQNEELNTEEGKDASETLKSLFGDKQIYLEYDEDRYDQYGRVLAYVYLSDKKTMVNREMVERGYARVVLYEPNSKYYSDLSRLEDIARFKRNGLWGTGYFRND